MAIRNGFNFLKVKAVPKLFWSSPKPLTIRPPLISIVMLVFGLILFGLGEALLIASGIGVSPWSVLAQGITKMTNISIGQATFIISVVVLMLWIPLKQTPGMGTVFNIIIISLVLDLSLPYLPQAEHLGWQLIEGTAGVLITGIGGGIYLIANLGPGPRDGLMTGLQRITQFPIAWIRSAIEVSVVILGWCLGGTVGIGTLLFAFGIGPSVALTMFCLQRYARDNGIKAP
jgi:uncharacterized membrane protein YczE